MAKAGRIPALSLLLLILAAPVFAIQLTGVEMTTTSRTVTLQSMKAEQAVVVGDRIVATNLSIETNLSEGKSAVASGEEGIIIFSGYEPVPDPERRLDAEGVTSYGRDFGNQGTRGDLLLHSRENPLAASFMDSGDLETSTLIWSEKYRRYFLPEEFVQIAKPDDGSTMEVRGTAASISSDFTAFTYFGTDEKPAAMTFTVNP